MTAATDLLADELADINTRLNLHNTRITTTSTRVDALEADTHTHDPPTPTPAPTPVPTPAPTPAPTPPPSDGFPTWPPPASLRVVPTPLRFSSSSPPTVHRNLIVRGDDHGHVDSGRNGLAEDVWFDVDGGDGGKPHTGYTARRAYYRCTTDNGSHLDIVQGQAETNFAYFDCVFEYLGGPRNSVTAFIFLQNTQGSLVIPVAAKFENIKLIGAGNMFGHDIRLGGTSALSTVTFTGLDLSEYTGDLQVRGGSQCRLTCDDTITDQHLRNFGGQVVRI